MQEALTVLIVSIAIIVAMIFHDAVFGPPNDTWWPTLGGVLIIITFLAAVGTLLALVWS